jgi:serine/threonine protein kinase
MRTCPACHQTYDNQKSYCVYDGQQLIDLQEIGSLVDRVIDNKYSIDYKIADGGTGTVYRATHLQLQLVVAIKVLHPALTNDVVAIERFRREAYAAMKIRHLNAVAVLDFGITEARLVYVVMELLIGQSLADRLKVRTAFSIVEANEYIQQVCAAVRIAHTRGIVHRDLKPENIFLHKEDGREIVKVLDFGIAKVQEFNLTEQEGEQLTETGTVVGTPYYIAPEQCSGQPVDARADIYSLGIVLYQLLTGNLPFDGPSTIIVLLKQLNEKPTPIYKLKPELPPLLNGVVMHALEKDPRSRPQTIASFADELAAAVGAVTDLEFKKLFIEATEKELDAALLLAGESTNRRPDTGDYSRIHIDSAQDESGRLHSSAIDREVRKLRGDLGWFDFATVIHMLAGLKETGLLTFYSVNLIPGREVEIRSATPFAGLYFDNGNVTRARLGVRIGREAFFQLFQMPLEGSFLFRSMSLPSDLEATESITDLSSILIKEAQDLRTLLDRYSAKFPDMLMGFGRSSEKLNWRETDSGDLAVALWEMLAQPGIMLTELLARSPCCNARTYRVLATLLATRQIAAITFRESGDIPRPDEASFDF